MIPIKGVSRATRNVVDHDQRNDSSDVQRNVQRNVTRQRGRNVVFCGNVTVNYGGGCSHEENRRDSQ